MTTGKQIRAARMLLEWDAEDLADKTELTRETIFNIERGIFRPRPATLEKIKKAFSDNGVEFNGDRGVELRDDKVREIDGPNCYARLLDEIYYELNKGEEFLVGMADESLSSQEVHAAHSRLVKKGIKFRKLIKEGNTSVHGPLEWYRHIDSIYYQNAASVFYKDKSAYLTENFEKIVIVKDNAIAQANKNFFELAWSHSQLVKQTTADERYE